MPVAAAGSGGVVPVVSVVVPAFDAEGTLGEQLEALAGQVGAPVFEVLVCDNGSRDGTAGVVRSFVGRSSGAVAWSGLRLVDASVRRGPAAARNVGAGVARGEHLLFCDADDVAEPGWVAAMHAGLGEHAMVAGPWDLARLNTHYAHVGDRAEPTFRMSTWDRVPAAGAGNLGVRSVVFAEVGGFDERLPVGEDVDLCWRAQLAGHELGEVEAVMHVRMRTGLRDVFRQAYSYGRAERQLAQKFAAVITDPTVPRVEAAHADSARDAAPAEPVASDSVPSARREAVPARAGALVRKVAKLRRPSDLTYAVRRLGRVCGSRFGRLDRSVPRYGGPVPGRVVVHDSGVVPVVSVVVPAFDAEGTLGEQLEALAGQVGAPVFEVLVCDNGSRDGTAGVVRSFVGRSSGAVAWSGLRLVDASVRRGPAAARNVGAGVARGEHLLFCDADDVVSPGWVAALHAALAADVVAAGPWEFRRLNPSVAEADRWGPTTFCPPVGVPLPAAGSGNLGIRADLYALLGGFDEHLRVGEDIDLCWRAQLAGRQLLEVPDAVLHVRFRAEPTRAFRQAFAYAGSDRQVAFKYRRVIDAYAAAYPDLARGVKDVPARTAWPRRAYLCVRKIAAELARLRHPGGAVLVSSEIGEWLGLRLTSVDRTVDVVVPPATLPEPVDVGAARADGGRPA